MFAQAHDGETGPIRGSESIKSYGMGAVRQWSDDDGGENGVAGDCISIE